MNLSKKKVDQDGHDPENRVVHPADHVSHLLAFRHVEAVEALKSYDTMTLAA